MARRGGLENGCGPETLAAGLNACSTLFDLIYVAGVNQYRRRRQEVTIEPPRRNVKMFFDKLAASH